MCSILGIKWQNHVSNEDIFKVQLRWAGHVTRIENVRIAKAVVFSELQEGKYKKTS